MDPEHALHARPKLLVVEIPAQRVHVAGEAVHRPDETVGIAEEVLRPQAVVVSLGDEDLRRMTPLVVEPREARGEHGPRRADEQLARGVALVRAHQLA